MSPSYLVVLGLTYSHVYFLPFCWSAVYCRKRTLRAVCFRLLCLLDLVNGRQCGGWGGCWRDMEERSQAFSPCVLSSIWKWPWLRLLLALGSGQATVVLASARWLLCVFRTLCAPFVPCDWESSSLSHRGSHSKYLRLCRPHSFCWNFSALWMGGAVFNKTLLNLVFY